MKLKIPFFVQVITMLSLLFVLTSSVSAQTFEASMGAGNHALSRGDFEQAITHFRAAAQRNPRSFEAQHNLAFALLNAGRHSNAETEFKKALGLWPENSQALLNLSIALQNQGKSGEALDALSRATKADPSNTVARINLASSYADAGRLPQALAEYKSMIDEGHSTPNILVNYAKCLITANRISEAKQFLQEALRSDVNNIEARWELADLYKKFDRDTTAAAQELRLAIASKSDEPKLYVALATLLEEQDKRQEAAEQVRKAIIYTNDALEKGRLQSWADRLLGRTAGSGPTAPASTPGAMQTLQREEQQPAKRRTTPPPPSPAVNTNVDGLLPPDEPRANPFDDIQKKGR